MYVNLYLIALFIIFYICYKLRPQIMKKIIALLIITTTLLSCSKTNFVFMTVTEPAPVTIPKYITKVGIINRSKPDSDNRVVNTLDKILSVKSAQLDIDGSKECIRGLKDELVSSNFFPTVISLDSLNLTSTSNPDIFQTPLSWDEVEKICNENNVDAIFSLELFHSSTKINAGINPAGKGTITGLPLVNFNASLDITVNTGWRIYDPQNKLILDEYPISQNMTFSGNGVNPAAAASALLSRHDAVKQTGYKVGQEYADRIIPYNIRVSREYFVRGSDNFKTAKRMAQAGNWQDAGTLWKKETLNPNRKIRGRACYNMAIINEINGNIDSAMVWAQKAYIEDNIRLALRYVNILKDRKNDNAVLKSQ